MPQKCMECFRLLLEHLAWIKHQFLSGIRDSRKAGSLRDDERCGRSKQVNRPELIGQKVRVRVMVTMWGFKGVQEEIPSEEASTVSTRTMHQSTTPSLSQTIWPRWASRQFLSLPKVQTLLPVTFGYPLKSEAVVMRELRRWKRLWWRSLTCSHKRTSMGPSRSCWNGTTNALQPEEITSKGTRVSSVYYSIKVAIGKKSGNLFNDPCIYIYTYKDH